MKDKINDIKVQEAEKFYASFLKYTQSVFTGIGLLDMDSITKKISELRNEVQHNRQFLLYAMYGMEHEKDENYLASHAIRTSAIAMIIGKYLKIAPHRLLELGIAAFLHDIGMLALPQETYLNELDLKAQEKEIINNHPLHSYNMLKSSKCTQAISSAVLEHHERENGSGYPRKLTGEHISLYGKIIAVACSYEALSAKRSYKKAKDQHRAMVELVRNKDSLYNITVIRALVTALSFYPIGTYVLLSDGKLGRVFDINPENQHYPIVQLEENTIITTTYNNVSIINSLTREEIDRKKEGWCSAKEFIMKHRPAAREPELRQA